MLQKLRPVLLEALVVVCLGLGLALVANQVSPRGLSLSRDYFARTPVVVKPSTNTVPTVAPSASGLKERLAERGIAVLDTPEVEKLVGDPQYEQELIIFVDARDDRHYGEGHIPGAYQFDRYYPERYMPAVLPACINAAKIVVYCSGGKCEDSEFAALTLLEAGIPADRISVYAGGITAWKEAKQPIELGARKSGQLQDQK